MLLGRRRTSGCVATTTRAGLVSLGDGRPRPGAHPSALARARSGHHGAAPTTLHGRHPIASATGERGRLNGVEGAGTPGCVATLRHRPSHSDNHPLPAGAAFRVPPHGRQEACPIPDGGGWRLYGPGSAVRLAVRRTPCGRPQWRSAELRLASTSPSTPGARSPTSKPMGTSARTPQSPSCLGRSDASPRTDIAVEPVMTGNGTAYWSRVFQDDSGVREALTRHEPRNSLRSARCGVEERRELLSLSAASSLIECTPDQCAFSGHAPRRPETMTSVKTPITSPGTAAQRYWAPFASGSRRRASILAGPALLCPTKCTRSVDIPMCGARTLGGTDSTLT